jgi:8-oxo-dGTP pyrophosphatase MutT (NUDIX family)
VTAGFRPLGERTIHDGHFLRFAVGTFEAPDGSTFERDILHHAGWVAVVPVTPEGEVVLVRQYRAAIDALLLELPAGVRDVPDEPLEQTAARELAEEVGLAAASMELLTSVHNSPGCADERGWIFLATGLSDVPLDAQGVEEQHMTIERIRLADAPRLIAEGEITDAKTQIGLLLAFHRHSFPR